MKRKHHDDAAAYFTKAGIQIANFCPPTFGTLRQVLYLAIALFVASNAKAGADIQYLLTTQNNPVRPSEVIEFDVTVHNLSTSPQQVTLDWTVPQYTFEQGIGGGGSPGNHNFGSIPMGGSITYRLFFAVQSADVVPEGQEITLTLHDFARAAMTEQTVIVRDSPALSLALSTEQGTVAPGDTFTYTLAAANISGGSLSAAQLSVDVPEGATLVSSDPPGQVSGNTVTWNLGDLVAGANERRNVTFRANAGSTPPLGAVNARLTDQSSPTHQAGASSSKVVIATPDFQYIVTAVQDPVQPQQVLEFDVTVHNLTTSSQSVRLDWTVPHYTFEQGVGQAGTPTDHDFGSIPMHQSVTYRLFFLVSPSTVVPDGGNITLELFDQARAASVSRSTVIRDSPALGLALSTEQGTVAPGDTFTYTLAAANISGGTLHGAGLSVDIPQGATLESSDPPGQVTGNTVTWSLGDLNAGANVRRNVTFRVNPDATPAPPPLGPINARLTDQSGHVARAGDARVVISTDPPFEYILTTVQDPAQPDQIVEFDVTVHNLTTASQSVRLDWTVPQYTFEQGVGQAGTATDHDFGSIPMHQSVTYRLFFLVSSNTVVPDGGNITLELFDQARGASVSRNTVIRDSPALGLALSTEQGTVAPGDTFTYTLAAANISSGLLQSAALSVDVPQGATLESSDPPGQLTGNTVTWSLGDLNAGANVRRNVTFRVNPDATPAPPPLGPINARLTDQSGHVARASDARVVISTDPFFEYILTAAEDPTQQGQVLDFYITVHNLTTSSQAVRMAWTVPQYTFEQGVGQAGAPTEHNFGSVPMNQSLQFHIILDVLAATVVPDGANISIQLFDLARGASVSKVVAVNPHAPATPTPTPSGTTPTPSPTPGGITPTPTPGGTTPTPTPSGSSGRLANISTRLQVQTDPNELIGGFIVTGTQAKKVIVRAIGPSLGVQGELANPTLELHDSTGAVIASNDNWMDAPNRQEIIDSTLAPTNDLESAILVTLPANSAAYTAVVRGANNTTGVGLVEAYDLDLAADSKLANISTRGLVQTGSNVMIGGFIVVQGQTRVIVRAIGGSLSVQGKLADPTLELHDSNGTTIATNDNWRSDQEQEIIATGIPPSDNMESAIVRPLDPGAYTAIVRGVNDTTGVALVEVYQLSN